MKRLNTAVHHCQQLYKVCLVPYSQSSHQKSEGRRIIGIITLAGGGPEIKTTYQLFSLMSFQRAHDTLTASVSALPLSYAAMLILIG